MHKIRVTLLVFVALLVFTGVVSASGERPEVVDFVALLNGDQEVPVRDTPALGAALFRQRGERPLLDYLLIVGNIENAFAAHIHCAPPGENGPIGVTLFMGEVASGPVAGVIAGGTIREPDDGNACGWESNRDVLDAIESGNAYVNVHTNDGVDPPDTGPGDFPGGEIRGQVFDANPGD